MYKDGDSYAYKCVYVTLIVQSRQKRKGALLSHRKRRRTHKSLLFDFQRLKIGCFKTAMLKNAWPCYRCSLSFRNELLVVSYLVVLISICFCLPFTPRGGRRIKIAVTQMMKIYYRNQCILRLHPIYIVISHSPSAASLLCSTFKRNVFIF